MAEDCVISEPEDEDAGAPSPSKAIKLQKILPGKPKKSALLVDKNFATMVALTTPGMEEAMAGTALEWPSGLTADWGSVNLPRNLLERMSCIINYAAILTFCVNACCLYLLN